MDNKISIESLKYQFFNKLAKYKNTNDLLSSLQSFKSKNIQWNKEYYEQLIKEKKLNVDILDDQHGYMMIQVNDYEACKLLGSQAWCISQYENYFFQYTSDYKRQFIALNFNQPIEDNTSMIGFTVTINGKVSDSYLKNDDETSKEEKDKFKFNSLKKQEIENILNKKTNQESFDFICQYGLIDFYDEYINKKNVDPSHNNNFSLRLASENGYLDIINRLINDPRVDPSDNNNETIVCASEYGHLDVVNRLLDDPRVDPSYNNDEAIICASQSGNLDIVNRLLDDPRVDPSNENNFAIRFASENGHLDVVNRLLDDPRVDPSTDNNYAIRWASQNGHLNVVNRLLEDPRVCKKLDKDWIKDNLNKEQLKKYEKILSMIKYKYENNKRKTNNPAM